MVILLAGSAFFSSVETAFSTVNMIRLRSMMEDGNKRAKTAISLIMQFDKLIATLLVGNNIVNMALSALATVFVTDHFGVGVVAVGTLVITFLVLTFGEILPKGFGKDKSEAVVLMTAPIISFLCMVLTPITMLFIWLKNLMSPKSKDNLPTITEQELLLMLDTIEKEGVLETEEKDLVQSALKFDDTTVQEILTPRVNIIGLCVDDSKEEIISTLRQERFSRLPVYRESIDNIIGLVHSNELYDALIDGGAISLEQLAKPCLYIHRTKRISVLMEEFQRKKEQLAVVIDDYGGTLGIVTMEDILEELVGEIWDEDDEIISDFHKLDENKYIVNGEANIEDFFNLIGYYPPDYTPDYYTINGWVLENLEHIPQEGDSFECGVLSAKVLEVKDQTALRVEIEKNTIIDDEE